MSTSNKPRKVGQIIKYKSSESVYEEKIVRVKENGYYLTIDHKSDSALTLWNLGCAVASDVHESQIIN